MSRCKRALPLLFVLAAMPFLRAESCHESHDPPPDCDERFGADAKGTWHITATGTRKDCKDAYLDGHMRLEIERFEVAGDPVATSGNNAGNTSAEADAFVERIRRAQYKLSAKPGAPRGLSFSGSVNTCDLSFEVSERLPDGSTHKYEFQGFLQSTLNADGTFHGEGPGSCVVDGDFDLDIRPSSSD